MKKLFVMTMLLMCGLTAALAQKPAEIRFDKLTHNFGTFSAQRKNLLSLVLLHTPTLENNR